MLPDGGARPPGGADRLAVAEPHQRVAFINRPHDTTQQIRLTDEAGDERIGRRLIDLPRGADLLDDALVHHHQAIGVDAQGRATTSAAEIATGGLLPFGSYKGFGLSLAIQAMGLLAGASLAHGSLLDFGPLFIVFDPGLLVPRERSKAELADLIATVKALPRQPGVAEIRIPSERAYREREQRRTDGVLLERRVYDRLMAL